MTWSDSQSSSTVLEMAATVVGSRSKPSHAASAHQRQRPNSSEMLKKGVKVHLIVERPAHGQYRHTKAGRRSVAHGKEQQEVRNVPQHHPQGGNAALCLDE